MAGSGNKTFKTAFKKGLGQDSDVDTPPGVEVGYGTPSHAAPKHTIYVKLDATMGTSSHYRNTDGSTTWAAMSDD